LLPRKTIDAEGIVAAISDEAFDAEQDAVDSRGLDRRRRTFQERSAPASAAASGLRGCSHRHFHPRVFGQRTPAHERHTCIRSGGAAHIGECCRPIAEKHHSEGRGQQIVFVQHGRGRIGLPPIDVGDTSGLARLLPSASIGGNVQPRHAAGGTCGARKFERGRATATADIHPPGSPARGSAKASKAFVTGASVMSGCSYRATLISPPFALPSSMSALISSGAAIPSLPTKRVRTLRSCRVDRTRCYTVTSSEGSSARRGVVRTHTNMGLNSGRLGPFSGILRTPPAVANCSCPLPPRTCGTETQDRGLGEPSLGRRLVPACHRRRGADAADFVPQRGP
jgi:hypothetical protein